MTHVLYCSTFFGAMTLAAAVDAGQLGAPEARRVLIVSNNAAVPEIGDRVDRSPGFDVLRDRFDDIVSWNDLIAPLHPAQWAPAAADVPLLSRMICARLGLDDAVELVLESVAVAPARTIAHIVRDVPITVFSDGLMSYGPTRDALPTEIGGRIGRVLYLDLVRSLEPLLLREYGVAVEAVPPAAFTRVVDSLPAPPEASAARGCPVIVGQYLSALAILTRAEEAELYAQMLSALAARGYRRIVFKPHPAAGSGAVRQLHARAREVDVELIVVADAVSAEAWLRAARPELVVSCFSTALMTAARYLNLNVAAMGAAQALERITPFQNSNRISATIVDAVVAELRADGTLAPSAPVDLPGLVHAVGFCMQPVRNPDLRAAAQEYVRDYGAERYFKRRRLEATGVVPGTAPTSRPARFTRSLRRARTVLRWAGRGTERRVGSPSISTR